MTAIVQNGLVKGLAVFGLQARSGLLRGLISPLVSFSGRGMQVALGEWGGGREVGIQQHVVSRDGKGSSSLFIRVEF